MKSIERHTPITRRVWTTCAVSMLLTVAMIQTSVVAQQAPTLQSPADLATNQSTAVELRWAAASGDSVYHLQIDTSSVFQSFTVNDSSLSGTVHTVVGLRNATTYYWRVSVKDSGATGGASSPFSAARSFTTWAHTPTTAHLPVTLGLAGGFAILSYAGISNTGVTMITGNVGVSPLAASYMTGFGTPNVTGVIYGVDATGPSGSVPFPSMLTVAMGDLTIAFNDAAGRTLAPIGIAGNIGGRTLYAGLYKSSGSLEITAGDLTLDAQGDINAIWIFQIASNFNMTSGRQIFLTGGAKASNVYWQVGSSATFGTTAVMKGTILAHTAVTFATGASLEGRAMSRTEAVTLQSNAIGGTTETPVRAAVFLGSAANFKVLAGSKITNSGATIITGDIGVSPSTAILGFPPGILTGVQHPGNATSAAAQADLHAAFDSAMAHTADSTIDGHTGGLRYTQGMYTSGTGDFDMGDTLTLDGEGDANAVWVFSGSGALTTAEESQVRLINNAQWTNVFWVVGGSATLGVNSSISGTIMASSSITTNDGAHVKGRLLALEDSVTLNHTALADSASTTSVGDEATPEGFTLSQNYPNPFNPSTMIAFSLERSGMVTLTVYNMIGMEVATLVNGQRTAGSHSVTFNAGSDGHSLSSGVYFYRLQSGGFVSIKKLVLIR